MGLIMNQLRNIILRPKQSPRCEAFGSLQWSLLDCFNNDTDLQHSQQLAISDGP